MSPLLRLYSFAPQLPQEPCFSIAKSGIIQFFRLRYRQSDTAVLRKIWRSIISNSDPNQLQTYLSQCALGNRASFEALYKSVSPQLYAVALKSLRNADSAEEILQESFIRIWHNAARYDSTLSAPMTWMINITRNLAIDLLRRRREDSLSDDVSQSGDERPDPDAGPFDLLASSQDKAALTRCLETLDVQQRQSVVITYFQGLSNTELAAQMCAPLGSIKSWIRRGMERLRSCLES